MEKTQTNKKEEAEDFEILDELDGIVDRMKDWWIEQIEAPLGSNRYYIKKVDNHIEIGYAKCELFC